ncbi:MAG: hypothetical protein ABIR34_13255 [Marmoricola sp.]
MSPMFITLIVILVAVFAVAIRMDVKRRRMGDARPSGDMSRMTRRIRVQGREKGSESGLGL